MALLASIPHNRLPGLLPTISGSAWRGATMGSLEGDPANFTKLYSHELVPIVQDGRRF